ncbi:MAG TPA: hypothetical protein VNT31_13995 [Nocardioides sp.]|nr:hypothetical protein [Nocardioides sp.]
MTSRDPEAPEPDDYRVPDGDPEAVVDETDADLEAVVDESDDTAPTGTDDDEDADAWPRAQDVEEDRA